MASQAQAEAPGQGRSFNKSFQIYKPRRGGGGSASQWELGSAKNAVFLEMAAQIGKMEDDENAKFDWSNKLKMKLGVADLGEIIACLERRQKGIGPLKDSRHRGLFHKNARGTASLLFEELQQGAGWHLKIGVQKTGAEVQNLSHSVTLGEGAALLVLLRRAIERIYDW
jgi:hypothetical protein